MADAASRENDVTALITEAKHQYRQVQASYEKMLRDKSLDLRIPIKNLMENLRSALDYIAHDIYDTCCRSVRDAAGKKHPSKIYFPYGRTRNDFKSNVGGNLPGLQASAPEAYAAIEGVQLFSSGDAWLCDLCSILNECKHDRLTPQTRTERQTHSVVSEHGSVTVPVNDPSIQVRSMPGAVKVFGVPADFTSDGIRTAPSKDVKHVRTTWVAFFFDGTNVNVLGLLERAVPGVEHLAEAVYAGIQ